MSPDSPEQVFFGLIWFWREIRLGSEWMDFGGDCERNATDRMIFKREFCLDFDGYHKSGLNMSLQSLFVELDPEKQSNPSTPTKQLHQNHEKQPIQAQSSIPLLLAKVSRNKLKPEFVSTIYWCINGSITGSNTGKRRCIIVDVVVLSETSRTYYYDPLDRTSHFHYFLFPPPSLPHPKMKITSACSY